MNILDEYINWADLWDEEVLIETSIDILLDMKPPEYERTVEVMKQFMDDLDVSLIYDECCLETYSDGRIEYTFCFGETGGQNESDTQGWSRDYTFVVDSDFIIIKAEYDQG